MYNTTTVPVKENWAWNGIQFGFNLFQDWIIGTWELSVSQLVLGYKDDQYSNSYFFILLYLRLFLCDSDSWSNWIYPTSITTTTKKSWKCNLYNISFQFQENPQPFEFIYQMRKKYWIISFNIFDSKKTRKDYNIVHGNSTTVGMFRGFWKHIAKC